MAGSFVAWMGWVIGLGQFLGDLQIFGAVDKEANAMLELAWGLAVDGCHHPTPATVQKY